MSDLEPSSDVDPDALAAEVEARLREALAAAGVDGSSPEVRRAVLAALTDRPLDRRYSAAEKRKMSLELRIAGASYREIAKLVGYAGPGPAQKTVMKALEALPREPAEQVRQLAIERLEGILSGSLYRKARGDRVDGKRPPHAEQMAAIDRVVAVMAAERRYIPGVEVPVNAELTGAGGGAIVVELSIPAPVPVEPIPQHALGGIIMDLPAEAITEGTEP